MFVHVRKSNAEEATVRKYRAELWVSLRSVERHSWCTHQRDESITARLVPARRGLGDLAPVRQARFEPHSRLTVYLAHSGFTDSDHLANLLKVQLLVIIKSEDQFFTLRQAINSP